MLTPTMTFMATYNLPVGSIFNDAERGFGRYRWALIWTPFGPVYIPPEAWEAK